MRLAAGLRPTGRPSDAAVAVDAVEWGYFAARHDGAAVAAAARCRELRRRYTRACRSIGVSEAASATHEQGEHAGDRAADDNEPADYTQARKRLPSAA